MTKILEEMRLAEEMRVSRLITSAMTEIDREHGNRNAFFVCLLEASMYIYGKEIGIEELAEALDKIGAHEMKRMMQKPC